MLSLDALIVQTLALEGLSEVVVGAHHLKTILAMPNERVLNVLQYVLPFLTEAEKNNIYIKVHTLSLLEDRETPSWLELIKNSKT